MDNQISHDTCVYTFKNHFHSSITVIRLDPNAPNRRVPIEKAFVNEF